VKNPLILLTILLTSNLAVAQFIKEKSINAQIGFCISTPYNSVDLGFAYYFQPSVEQYAGAFALGLTFPLNKK
jgi:hypothetical protein